MPERKMKEFFQAIQKKKISEDIIGQIKDLILRKKLNPGERLPSEREFAEMLNVGRPAIRETLRSLEMIGLIEVHQGRGSFVKELDFGAYLGALKDSVTFTLLSESVSLEDFYNGRKLIEPAIARLVAEKRDGEDLKTLETLVQDTRGALNEGERFIKYSAFFHQQMAHMTRNKVARFSMDFLLTISPQARLQRFSRKSFREMVACDHERIVERIRRRDGQGASREMESHLDNLARGRAQADSLKKPQRNF